MTKVTEEGSGDDGDGGDIVRELVQWISDGLRKKRHVEEYRGARLDPIYKPNGKFECLNLRFSDGRFYKVSVKDFRVDLVAATETDEELPRLS